jgi:hypothetical protein
MTFCVSSTYGYPSSRKNSLNRVESSSGAWMPAKTLPRSAISAMEIFYTPLSGFKSLGWGEGTLRTCAMIPVMEQ